MLTKQFDSLVWRRWWWPSLRQISWTCRRNSFLHWEGTGSPGGPSYDKNENEKTKSWKTKNVKTENGKTENRETMYGDIEFRKTKSGKTKSERTNQGRHSPEKTSPLIPSPWRSSLRRVQKKQVRKYWSSLFYFRAYKFQTFLNWDLWWTQASLNSAFSDIAVQRRFEQKMFQ